MLRMCTITALGLLWCATTACDSGPHSGAGFRLPSGDIERGRVAFVSHNCTSCHAVAGTDLPRSQTVASAPVILGGETFHQITDGYLVTSIVNPSYVLAAYAQQPPSAVRARPHMPDYAEQLTVREVIDLVSFLQSKYSVQRAPRYPASF